MFDSQLQTALDTGAEILVQLRNTGGCSEPYQGRILAITPETFNLYHSGSHGGVLWTFRKQDIACCGLIVEAPPFGEEVHSFLGTEAETVPQRDETERL
jgi:hypothetical protein